MSRTLLMLVGSKTAVPGEVPTPTNPLEPYRVVWNPTVMYGNPSEYVTMVTDKPGFSAVVKNTAVLTDHAPLEYEPEMFTRDLVPVDINITGFPVLAASRPQYPITGMRIENITDIAHANRTNKLPKVFEIRFVSTAAFNEMDLMRYNLTADGSKYVAIRINKVGDSYTGYIKACLNGSDVIASTTVPISGDVGTSTTETISLVIFHNKVEIHIDDPGTVVSTLNLPGPLIPYEGASFELIREDYLEDGQTPPVLYAIDGLYIYDGYF